MSKLLTDNDIKRILKEDEERCIKIKDLLDNNPCCEKCSCYFPGCIACKNVLK